MQRKQYYISIIVPAYNAEKTIAQCIESLLIQNYPKDLYEIIIVDNNSTDNTAKIIKQYPVKYLVENKIQGPSAARNKGIINAKGEILAFTDSDCIASPQWLKKAVEVFSSSQDIGCVGGKSVPYKPKGLVDYYLSIKGGTGAKEGPISSFPIPYFPTLNVFYKKEVFDLIGLFDTNFYWGEDVDFCWRMQLYTKFKLSFAPEAIIYHQERSTIKSLFKQRKGYAKGRVLLYKKYKKLLPKRTLKEVYWSYYHLISRWSNLTKKLLIALIKRKNRNYWYNEFIEAIIITATKLGHIEGSLIYKYLYL